MAGRNYQLRFVGPTALMSALLLSLCILAAVYLYQQQTGSAEVLGENIGSRQAAANLEESLNDLIALHRTHADRVGGVQERIEKHLREIQQFADKRDEQALVLTLTRSFERYQRLIRDGAVDQALDELEKKNGTLDLCRELRNYNAHQTLESERVHRETVRWLAWGLAAVGGAGSLAGLLLGYAVARGLRRSIHKLQVRVRDAAGKLGQDLPDVILDDADLDHLHEQMRELVTQIEQVVQQLQQREHEVLRAEQLAAVGQLAAGVAHEIRNPLTSIKMLIQAGREEAEARGFPSEDLKVIELEIRRMERSLKTFLEFARPPKLERAAVDLATLIDRTLNLVRGRATKQHVELRFVAPDSPVTIQADGEQLQQVLVNLILNALDVMPRGGTLEVALQRREQAVEVSVTDTGPGIAAEVMPRLFQPFVSGKETGLGLGLVVSRRIVEDHGGTLRATNRHGGGACFVMRLPATSAACGLPAV